LQHEVRSLDSFRFAITGRKIDAALHRLLGNRIPGSRQGGHKFTTAGGLFTDLPGYGTDVYEISVEEESGEETEEADEPVPPAVPGPLRRRRPRRGSGSEVVQQPRPVIIPQTGPPARRCDWCRRTDTRQWRTGPNGPSTLCNNCGSTYSRGSNRPGAASRQPVLRPGRSKAGAKVAKRTAARSTTWSKAEDRALKKHAENAQKKGLGTWTPAALRSGDFKPERTNKALRERWRVMKAADGRVQMPDSDDDDDEEDYCQDAL